MSRIGNKHIIIPEGVTVTLDGSTVTVKGPKGTLTNTFNPIISIKQEENERVKYLNSLAKIHGFSFEVLCQNPFFECKGKSELREALKSVYEKLYDKKVIEKHIHAGLEGGVFAENIENLDVCVAAADIYDLHSTKERVDIASVERTYEWIKQSLIEFAK